MADKGDHNKTYLYILFRTTPTRKELNVTFNVIYVIYSSYTVLLLVVLSDNMASSDTRH